jgi:photosystem I reaction center subunit XII
MYSQLLSVDDTSSSSSFRASSIYKKTVALGAAVGLLAGALVALSMSADVSAEPINLAALPTSSSSIALRPRISSLPRTGPLKANQLRGLEAKEKLEVKAELGALENVAHKIMTGTATAGMLAHPIASHAANPLQGYSYNLPVTTVYSALFVALIAMIAADRLGKALYQQGIPPGHWTRE